MNDMITRLTVHAFVVINTLTLIVLQSSF